jgi:hypothetical protein
MMIRDFDTPSDRLRKVIDILETQAIKDITPLITEVDFELAHASADRILCRLLSDLGLTKVVEAYQKVTRYHA